MEKTRERKRTVECAAREEVENNKLFPLRRSTCPFSHGKTPHPLPFLPRAGRTQFHSPAMLRLSLIANFESRCRRNDDSRLSLTTPRTTSQCGIRKLVGAINRATGEEGKHARARARKETGDLEHRQEHRLFSVAWGESGTREWNSVAKCRLLLARSVRAPVERGEGIHSAVQRKKLPDPSSEPRWVLEPHLSFLLFSALCENARVFLRACTCISDFSRKTTKQFDAPAIQNTCTKES